MQKQAKINRLYVFSNNLICLIGIISKRKHKLLIQIQTDSFIESFFLIIRNTAFYTCVLVWDLKKIIIFWKKNQNKEILDFETLYIV